MAKGRAVEKNSWKNTKTSILLSNFSTDLPMNQDEPIGKNDSECEFIAKKRDEKFPQQDDLCNDTAHPRDE
jgi:hypothetical protein